MALCLLICLPLPLNWHVTWDLKREAIVSSQMSVLMRDRVSFTCTFTCWEGENSGGHRDRIGMRIAIDYTAGIRQGAGIGNYVRNLVDAMLAQDFENQYILLTSGRPTRERPFPKADN